MLHIVILRLKELELDPYTSKEAERAAGMGSYVAPKRRKVENEVPVRDETEEEKKEREGREGKRKRKRARQMMKMQE